MALRMCILGSGSKGNSIYVASEQTALLVDAGLSARQTKMRLKRIGADLDEIEGICISHEHHDHIAGLRVLSKNMRARLYANAGTVKAVSSKSDVADLEWNVFSTGSPFKVGDLTIAPFALSHDAYEPVGYVIASEDDRVGIATDLGMVTTLARERLKGCRALVLEANHDEKLLVASRRPWYLKQRIMSRQGHLSNAAAAAAIVDCAGESLSRVYLAHLSEECNEAGLAKRQIEKVLKEKSLGHVELFATYPDRESECWEC